MDSRHDSNPVDQVDAIHHHPLYPIPPPPPAGSSSSPRGAEDFHGGTPDRGTPFRKHAPKDATDAVDHDSFSGATDRRRRRTTRIGFVTRVRTRETLSRYDMSPAERRAYWIQQDEYLAITRRNARIVQIIQKSYDDNEAATTTTKRKQQHAPATTTTKSERDYPDGLCPRGLEGGLKSEYMTRHAAVSESLEEVFNEQEKQYYIGVRDDEAIAESYATVSSKAAFRARLRAMLDRKEIEGYATTDKDEDDDDEEENDENAPLRSASNHTASSGKSKRSTGSKLRKQVASIRSWVRSGTKATLGGGTRK